MKQGIPQGSILGPLLYILYVNDLGKNIKKCKVTFYADDTVLYATNKSTHKAMRKVQGELDRLTTWCKSNGLTINPEKSKYVVFSNRGNNPNDDTGLPVLKTGGVPIQRVPSFNYLGVTLDCHLNFEGHIKKLISKVSAKVMQLRKLRHFITDKAALLIYKNMILPIAEYGDIFLTSATLEMRKKLQVLQNTAIKCALSKDKRFSTKQVHLEANLLKLKDRRKQHILQHMYKISNKKTFQGWKTRTSGVKTRQGKKKLMQLKRPNTTTFQNSLTYQGPRRWNMLPIEIQNAEDYPTFKQKLVKHLSERPPPF